MRFVHLPGNAPTLLSSVPREKETAHPRRYTLSSHYTPLGFTVGCSFGPLQCVFRNTQYNSFVCCLDIGFLQLESFVSNLMDLKTFVIFLYIFPDASERHSKVSLGYWTCQKRNGEPLVLYACFNVRCPPLERSHGPLSWSQSLQWSFLKEPSFYFVLFEQKQH